MKLSRTLLLANLAKKRTHSNQLTAHKVLENTAVVMDLLDPQQKSKNRRTKGIQLEHSSFF